MPFCLLILISNCLVVNECIQVAINSYNTETCRVEKWDCSFPIPLHPLIFLISQEVNGCLSSRMVPCFIFVLKSSLLTAVEFQFRLIVLLASLHHYQLVLDMFSYPCVMMTSIFEHSYMGGFCSFHFPREETEVQISDVTCSR